MGSATDSLVNERLNHYSREMVQSIAKKNEEDPRIIEVLKQDGSDAALDFLDYWQRVKETWDKSTELIKMVLAGEKTVSNEVIEDCRSAYMRLSQILHVLLEMREAPLESRATKTVMITISRRAYDDRQEAKRAIDTISLWQREAVAITRGDVITRGDFV